MNLMSKACVTFCCVLACVAGVSGLAQAEEATASGEEEATAAPTPAAAPAEEGEPAEAAPPAQAAPPASQAPPEQGAAGAPPPTRAVPDALVRLGRVEMVLIENEDAESALEFGQELLTEDGDNPRLRMLLAACLMTMRRPADALEHFNRVVDMSSSDAALQLQALYNVARALQGAGRLQEAAAAYDRYAAFARSHQDLPSFVENATRLARTLRTRAEAAE